MPAGLVRMSLFNPQPPMRQIQARALHQANLSPSPKPKSTALNASMIGRIFNVKPGCGSCGRH